MPRKAEARDVSRMGVVENEGIEGDEGGWGKIKYMYPSDVR